MVEPRPRVGLAVARLVIVWQVAVLAVALLASVMAADPALVILNLNQEFANRNNRALVTVSQSNHALVIPKVVVVYQAAVVAVKRSAVVAAANALLAISLPCRTETSTPVSRL